MLFVPVSFVSVHLMLGWCGVFLQMGGCSPGDEKVIYIYIYSDRGLWSVSWPYHSPFHMSASFSVPLSALLALACVCVWKSLVCVWWCDSDADSLGRGAALGLQKTPKAESVGRSGTTGRGPQNGLAYRAARGVHRFLPCPSAAARRAVGPQSTKKLDPRSARVARTIGRAGFRLLLDYGGRTRE